MFRPDEPQLRSLAQGRGLPQLHGPADQADLVWSTFQRWNELLGMHGLQAVSIRRDARGGWALGLRQSVRLLLGRHDMEPRLRRWLRVQEGVGAVALARVAQIDLRYTNGFAVAWKAGPPEQADSGVTDAENG